MANGILSLIQPNGSDKFNLRAENIFYFKASTNTTGNPGSGYVGTDASNALVFAHDNIVTVSDGMIIAFESPVNWDYTDVYIKNGTSLLNTTPLTFNDRNGNTTLNKGEWFVMVLMNNQFNIINSHIVETVSANSKRPVSSDAVKSYVDSLITNRWKYIVSNSAATTPNKASYNGTTGTLAPSANTEYIIYLVPHTHEANKDIYDEWITVKNGSTYAWEKIGNTDVDLSGIIENVDIHKFTPVGTVSTPIFSGDKVSTDSKGAHTHSVTATGSVSSTFSGTQKTLTGTTDGHEHEIAANGITVKGSVTAAGSVSQPTFTGSQSTTSTESAHKHAIAEGAISVSGTFNPSTIAISAGSFTGTEATIAMSNSSAISTSTTDTHSHTIAKTDLRLSGSVTAAGTVTKPTFTGTAATIEVANNTAISTDEKTAHQHTFSANSLTVSSSYTPAGSVSAPTITVTPSAQVYSITGVGTASSYTVSNEVLTLTPSTVPTKSSSAITFSGSATAPTFTGTQATITSKNASAQTIGSGGAHLHTIAANAISLSTTYTPEGSVSQPTFDGSAVTVTVNPANDITISGGSHGHTIAAKAINLSNKYTPAGKIDNPTITTNSITVTSTNAAAFNTESAGGHSHTVTAAGTVSKPTFTGSAVTVTSTNEAKVATTNVSDDISITYKPEGSVSSTFDGTSATTDEKGGHTHDVTATGKVSQPTFNGTEVTLTHTKKA